MAQAKVLFPFVSALMPGNLLILSRSLRLPQYNFDQNPNARLPEHGSATVRWQWFDQPRWRLRQCRHVLLLDWRGTNTYVTRILNDWTGTALPKAACTMQAALNGVKLTHYPWLVACGNGAI